MKGPVLILAVTGLLAGTAAAADMSPADAFNAGKDFANSAKGKDAAKGTLTPATGTATVPKYNTTAPEKSIYGGGKSLIGAQGTAKQAVCKDYSAPSAYEQQECDAVNYLQKQPSDHPKFTIDKKTDPIMVNSKATIANPGAIPGASAASCTVVKTTVPGTFTYETCVESQTLENLTCNTVLAVACKLPAPDCAPGGIVKTSLTGSYIYGAPIPPTAGIATFGFVRTIPDGAGDYSQGNTWSDNLTINVVNLSQMPYAVLAAVEGGNSHRSIDVNGVTVYSETGDGGRVIRCAPDGTDIGGYYAMLCSDKIATPVPPGKKNVCDDNGCYDVDVPAHMQYKPILSMANNYGANPGNRYPNIDLRPYLVEGANTINIHATTGGYGYKGGGNWKVGIRMTVQCDAVCTDTWDNSQCAPLEARAK